MMPILAIGDFITGGMSNAFGGAEIFAIISIIIICFVLFMLNIPAIFVFMCAGLTAMGFFMTGGIIKTIIAIAGVVLGTILAFGIWSIFKKGD
ncbi:MAG TPA: hypothetical protein P5098_00500 [Candidatus Dojkabacteria bacterium]|nr:hypothetical protein [Candidatus Dojkabacteria bacterium]